MGQVIQSKKVKINPIANQLCIKPPFLINLTLLLNQQDQNHQELKNFINFL